MAKPNVVSKQELIEAAKQCIVEQGLEKLTLKMVAERIGVTQGTVYYHFQTKDRLMLDVVKDVCERSWNEFSALQTKEFVVSEALGSAKERGGPDSFFHRLFLSLVVFSLKHEETRKELGALISFENGVLADRLRHLAGAENPPPSSETSGSGDRPKTDPPNGETTRRGRQEAESGTGDADDRLMGMSFEVWAVVINAIFDGLAVQSLVSPALDRDKVFTELGRFFERLLREAKPE
ncbi:TetR/AcrR family transcriptional regulator [Paenibacillus sp. VCA1]|uniref:TetR/AcrR family transcriptional regulator n=1 Tax=Paenibacillus sp. VCA1 TaxID=3039148 RepID=UPI0028712EFD|nr:TetR/AcrR family transcriptional regulator [Paenibacillus sp. VCA1]MDR9857451.1 TetR/AcrR family transcriptional regulator [Paenibacillus sp. VCA1]